MKLLKNFSDFAKQLISHFYCNIYKLQFLPRDATHSVLTQP